MSIDLPSQMLQNKIRALLLKTESKIKNIFPFID
jgi:hypothetical protein